MATPESGTLTPPDDYDLLEELRKRDDYDLYPPNEGIGAETAEEYEAMVVESLREKAADDPAFYDRLRTRVTEHRDHPDATERMWNALDGPVIEVEAGKRPRRYEDAVPIYNREAAAAIDGLSAIKPGQQEHDPEEYTEAIHHGQAVIGEVMAQDPARIVIIYQKQERLDRQSEAAGEKLTAEAQKFQAAAEKLEREEAYKAVGVATGLHEIGALSGEQARVQAARNAAQAQYDRLSLPGSGAKRKDVRKARKALEAADNQLTSQKEAVTSAIRKFDMLGEDGDHAIGKAVLAMRQAEILRKKAESRAQRDQAAAAGYREMVAGAPGIRGMNEEDFEAREIEFGTIDQLRDELRQDVEILHLSHDSDDHDLFADITKAGRYLNKLNALVREANPYHPGYEDLLAERAEVARLYFSARYQKEAARLRSAEIARRNGERDDFHSRIPAQFNSDRSITMSDGSGVAVYPDGSFSVTLDDGSSRRLNADGTTWQPYNARSADEMIATTMPEVIDEAENMPLPDLHRYAIWSVRRAREALPNDPYAEARAKAYCEVYAQRCMEITYVTADPDTRRDYTAQAAFSTYWAEYFDIQPGAPQKGRMLPDGSVAVHREMHGREGLWRIWRNGVSELVTRLPGGSTRYTTYAADGTIIASR